MSVVFDWHQLGESLEVTMQPGGRVRVVVDNDGEHASAELSIVAVAELRAALGEVVTDPEVEQLEEALGATERERDIALERVRDVEAELRERLAEVETLKSALDLADTRARATEADLAELRGELAGDAPQDALAVLDRIGARR